MLVTNLCKPPYAGSFMIFLLDNFVDLTSSKKNRKYSDKFNKGAVSTSIKPDDPMTNFEKIWVQCLEGVYPMEI